MHLILLTWCGHIHWPNMAMWCHRRSLPVVYAKLWGEECPGRGSLRLNPSLSLIRICVFFYFPNLPMYYKSLTQQLLKSMGQHNSQASSNFRLMSSYENSFRHNQRGARGHRIPVLGLTLQGSDSGLITSAFLLYSISGEGDPPNLSVISNFLEHSASCLKMFSSPL